MSDDNTSRPEPQPQSQPQLGHHHYAAILSLIAVAVSGFALVSISSAGTIVPGQQKQIDENTRNVDSDANGYPDAGVVMTGKYTSLYAYDDAGNWYWDLGDGRVQGTVGSVDGLDGDTLTTCDYQVEYRGEFGNTPFLDEGWITNNINCKGFDDDGHYNYFIVSQTDPRYRGNPDWAVWGTWEYHGLTVSGQGNLVRPMTPAGI